MGLSVASFIFFSACFITGSTLTRVPSLEINGTACTCGDSGFQCLRSKVSEALLIDITKCGGPGWRKVISMNISDPNQSCPSGLRLQSTPFRLCGRFPTISPSCTSIMLSTGTSSYSIVCGRIKGFHQNLKYAFYRRGESLDDNYVDGVSLTHGPAGNRQHIWSFAVGLRTINSPGERIRYYCPGDGQIPLPSFVSSSDYFCDSGAYDGSRQVEGIYVDSPLWDGVDCIGDPYMPNRCIINQPPWFYKVLSTPTSDDMELRLCGYELHLNSLYGDTFLQEIEIYAV